jgi:Tfp pilus assembly PilM family ATPase
MSKHFFDFFPVPKFLDMPSVGLSINDDSLSLIDLRQKKGKILLDRHDFQKMPPGAIESGEIKKTDEVIKILSDFKNKHKLHFIRTTLPEEKAFLFRTTMPNIPDSEIREALQFKIEENVPVTASEAVFDFYTVSLDGKSQDVIVTVVPKGVVSQYLDVLDKSGLTPLSLEIESQAIARATVRNGDKQTYLIVNVGDYRTSLHIVSNNLVQFTSSLAFGKSFFSSVAQEDSDNKKPMVSTGEVKVYNLQHSEEALLREEVHKVVDYWESLNHAPAWQRKVDKMIACGEEVTSKNFREYFSSHFSKVVEPANVWVNAFSLDDYIPDITFDESLKYAPSVGSALAGVTSKSRI